jgi:hypothetical protein
MHDTEFSSRSTAMSTFGEFPPPCTRRLQEKPTFAHTALSNGKQQEPQIATKEHLDGRSTALVKLRERRVPAVSSKARFTQMYTLIGPACQHPLICFLFLPQHHDLVQENRTLPLSWWVNATQLFSVSPASAATIMSSDVPMCAGLACFEIGINHHSCNTISAKHDLDGTRIFVFLFVLGQECTEALVHRVRSSWNLVYIILLCLIKLSPRSSNTLSLRKRT